ncbi:NUDIX hydrolase [Cytobacillus spongiae]|uniref:NUDIX hydrolase n=1 Tax=Cytobacillus spongiae TaxID=2901381 RepID=UPI001F3916D5|nr:NUDIX hydrolase [Cytobacillus spongiae]UII56550.1 NUDIX hydrolase [Cytobacillus spongiae]
MIREDVVYGLIFNQANDKVLMVKNMGSVWTLPGGAVENGETLEQAVIREVKEETNLTIEIEHIVAVNEVLFAEKGVHPIFFTFKVKVVDGEIGIIDENEISEIKWVDLETANVLMPYHPNGIRGLLASNSSYIFQL